MMLVDPTIVRGTLGFDDMTDINDAIEAASHAATASIAARLSTEFDRAESVDTFYVIEPMRQVGQLYQTEFRLRNGFLVSLDSLYYSSTLAAFGTADAVSSLTNMVVSLEKGLLTDVVTNYTRLFVRAAYTYGFEADGVNASLYEATQVPAWLQEAAKAQTMVLMASSPELKQAEVTVDTRMHQQVLDNILGQHARYTPLATLPL